MLRNCLVLGREKEVVLDIELFFDKKNVLNS
jgi:hypothetical protein